MKKTMWVRKMLGISLSVAMLATTGCAGNVDESGKSSTPSQLSEASKVTESVASGSAASVEESSAATQDTGITFPLEETMTFTGLTMINTQNVAISDSPVFQALCEKANIAFDLTAFPKSEIKEKGNLMLTGGSYPEVLFKSNLDCNKWGMEGILIPLEDLIREYAPNLTALLDERDGWGALTATDGHVYSLPRIGEMTISESSTMWVNTTWLKNVGMDMPTNTDELYEVLKAFKEKDGNGNGKIGDEIPLSFPSNKITFAMRYFCEFGTLGAEYMGWINDEYLFYPTTEEFKEYLKYFAKLYAEGLINPNALTIDDAQSYAQALTDPGNVFGMFAVSQPTYYLGDDVELVKSHEGMLPFGSVPFTNGVTRNGLAITDKCENPEVIIAWADYFYSEEGAIASVLGFEGEQYELDENGYYTLNTTDAMPTVFHWSLFGSCPQPGLVPDLYYSVNPETDPAGAHQRTENVSKKVLNQNLEMQILPTLLYTQEEDDRLTIIETDIVSYVDSTIAKVISGTVSCDDIWEEFCGELEKMGVKEYEKINKDAYDRQNK